MYSLRKFKMKMLQSTNHIIYYIFLTNISHTPITDMNIHIHLKVVT